MLYPAVVMNLYTMYKNRDKAYCYGSCMLELLSLDSSFVKKNNKKRFRDTLPFDVKKQTPSIAEDYGLVIIETT